MAEQKKRSQAQKAASGGKKNRSASGGKQRSEGEQLQIRQPNPYVRLIGTLVCLSLFVLLLVMFFKPEGALVLWLYDVLLGIFGKGSFLVAIPVVLYIASILAFSPNRPVKMRVACLVSFILILGVWSHLAGTHSEITGNFFQAVAQLYQEGVAGQGGGVLCGGLAMGLAVSCGTILSHILLAVAAVLTLLGGMQITIPGIVRAVQEIPRQEDEEPWEERPEPAALLVNHVYDQVNRQKQRQQEQQALRREQQLQNPEPAPPVSSGARGTDSGKPVRSSKVKELFRQIDGAVEDPVAVAGVPVKDVTEPGITAPEPETLVFRFDPEDAVEEKSQTQPEEAVAPPAPAHEAPPQPPVAAPEPEKVTAKDARESAAQVAQEIAQSQAEPKPEYRYPPLELLRKAPGPSTDGTAEMKENSARLNETLDSFKIDAHIINVTRGPSVTRYEVELEKGVRLNKLTAVADDIALSLGAPSVRIAPVLGKISVVGIEVPNRAVTTVSLREVIASGEFTRAKSRSSFAVGKDIGGSCIVGDIAKLPHMLIAGTTGSGKSVCMNSIIVSLLYKASPEEVKLIMVDPKMVELGIYSGIPHLLIPVVTDPKKAAGSLQWAVTEMMRRYRAMSDAGVKDLETYNAIMDSEGEEQSHLPQVVVIIDELADLMLVAAKEVEESICRIAQMGRAAGIHLIIATQRPSADVITGLMKANIPSRIAFAVASAMESRIILDTQGAEKLVGKGDMLYAPIGCGKPKRVQGCFVSETEVEAVTSYIKENFDTEYDQTVLADIEKNAAKTGSKQSPSQEPQANGNELAGDEMLPQAVEVILETGQASVSMLQRRLKLGYARAARIVDEMEEKGIVGPFQGSKPRTILITKEQWAAMNGGQSIPQEQMRFEDLPQDEDDLDDQEME